MKVGFTFTNYNNTGFTADLLKSLALAEGIDQCHIVVVDNRSTEPSRRELVEVCARYGNVSVILNEENLGYFKGLNCGIARLRRDFPAVEHIVIGNNDLVFPADIVTSILASAEAFAGHAVICPDIVGPDGEHQNPHVIKPIGWKRELVYDLYYGSYVMAQLILAVNNALSRFTRRMDHLHHGTAMSIHQGYGACYVLGPLFLSRFKELWAPTFLMGEEYFLSKQLDDAGLDLYYLPTIRLHHSGHATTREVPRRRMWELARESHRVYRQYKKVF